jgi:hypothetical protein
MKESEKGENGMKGSGVLEEMRELFIEKSGKVPSVRTWQRIKKKFFLSKINSADSRIKWFVDAAKAYKLFSYMPLQNRHLASAILEVASKDFSEVTGDSLHPYICEKYITVRESQLRYAFLRYETPFRKKEIYRINEIAEIIAYLAGSKRKQ